MRMTRGVSSVIHSTSLLCQRSYQRCETMGHTRLSWRESEASHYLLPWSQRRSQRAYPRPARWLSGAETQRVWTERLSSLFGSCRSVFVLADRHYLRQQVLFILDHPSNTSIALTIVSQEFILNYTTATSSDISPALGKRNVRLYEEQIYGKTSSRLLYRKDTNRQAPLIITSSGKGSSTKTPLYDPPAECPPRWPRNAVLLWELQSFRNAKDII
jgi:hypothetical protein